MTNALFAVIGPNVAAVPIFTAVKEVLSTIYQDVSGVLNIVAIMAVIVCLIGMMISKNSKTVEEFRAWRNRIVVSWIIINVLGSFVTYADQLFRGYSDVNDFIA